MKIEGGSCIASKYILYIPDKYTLIKQVEEVVKESHDLRGESK
jgi:hypothetical protein